MNTTHEHRRRSIRLKGHDYTQPGAYFVTLVTWQFDAFVVMPNHVHGIIMIDPEIVGATRPTRNDNLAGNDSTPEQARVGHDGSPVSTPLTFAGMDGLASRASEIDQGIVGGATRPTPDRDRNGEDRLPDQAIDCGDGSPLRITKPNGPQAGSLGAMIGQFKSRATKRIWAFLKVRQHPIWQRNNYEHIGRNENDLTRIWRYIDHNPFEWEKDQLNPQAPPHFFYRES